MAVENGNPCAMPHRPLVPPFTMLVLNESIIVSQHLTDYHTINCGKRLLKFTLR
jgi:hypothetical protein